MESAGPFGSPVHRRRVCAEMVLVIGAEPEPRAVTALTLREGGFYVLEADSGEAALGQLMTDACDTALLVADGSVTGMSGFELAAEVRSLRPGIRVLLVAAHGAEDQIVARARLALERQPAA